MLDRLRELVQFYLDNATQADLMLFGWMFAVFVLLLLISAAAMFRRPLLGTVILLLDIILFVCGLFMMPGYFDEIYRARSLTEPEIKEMFYSKTTIVTAELTNNSPRDFKMCRVSVKFIKNGDNALASFFAKMRPVKTHFEDFKDIKSGQMLPIRFVFDGFSAGQLRVIAESECF